MPACKFHSAQYIRVHVKGDTIYWLNPLPRLVCGHSRPMGTQGPNKTSLSVAIRHNTVLAEHGFEVCLFREVSRCTRNVHRAWGTIRSSTHTQIGIRNSPASAFCLVRRESEIAGISASGGWRVGAQYICHMLAGHTTRLYEWCCWYFEGLRTSTVRTRTGAALRGWKRRPI